MPRYLITIKYDGSCFNGWQVQLHGRSIQRELEKALSRFSSSNPKVTGAGRTDTGVHALAQSAHFDYVGNMHPTQIIRAFNRFLPNDIQVQSIIRTSDDFSARYDAYLRSYRYILSKKSDPFTRLYTGWVKHLNLRLEPMQEAAKCFLGKHDYSSFGKPNPEVPNRICEVTKLDISEDDSGFVFNVSADRFLHNMVRRMVGALCTVSHHDLPPQTISEWLEDANPRQRYAYPVPASGLYLIEVKYPEELLLEAWHIS